MNRWKTFNKGGIHPPGNKLSRNAAIQVAPISEKVVIPLSQHIGAPAEVCVAKGDQVRVGDLLGRAKGFVSANIHSSVSGTVTSLETVADGGGTLRAAVTIAVQGDEWLETIDRTDTLIRACSLSSDEILARIQEAGIVGMGGATFPAHVKLTIPSGKQARWLIVNGVECEPYLTADHRLMLEHGEEILVGISILCRALGVEKAYIGIEANKPDAIENLRNLSHSYYPLVEIVPLKIKYPQGGEKQLIQAVTGCEVPSGALPIDVGAVVQNIGSVFAVYEAVQKRKPLIERIVTVTGKRVAQPSNLSVRIGTPMRYLIDLCGGVPDDSLKIINGGPLMGRAVVNPEAPITKGTSGILMMRRREAVRRPEGPCLKCAQCVQVCPMGLEPYLLHVLSRQGKYDDTERLHITDCIECGSCAYSCPACLPLLDYIRLGKHEVMSMLRARKA